MPLFVASPNGFPRATQAVPSLANATSVPGSLADALVGSTRVHVTPLSAEHQMPDGMEDPPNPRTPAKRMFCFPAAGFTASAPIEGPPRNELSGVPAVTVHFRTPSP